MSLKIFDYNNSNSALLLTDIKNVLNDDAIWVVGFLKILGLEWNCSIHSGKVLIEYQIAKAIEGYWSTTLVENTQVGNNSVWGAAAAAAANPDTTTSAISQLYIAKGCGYYRTRIGSLLDSGTDTENGYYVGVTRTPVEPLSFSKNEMDYGVRVTITAGVKQYWVVKLDASGTFQEALSATVPTLNGVNDVTNDIVEIMINGKSVLLNIWIDGATSPITLASFAYKNSAKYLSPSQTSTIFCGKHLYQRIRNKWIYSSASQSFDRFIRFFETTEREHFSSYSK